MEKQRLARSGGGNVAAAAGPAVNGHTPNIPQRHHQAGVGGGGGRGSNRSSAEPVHHHKVVVGGADATSLNDLATGHTLPPHSLRRLSNGAGAQASGSFIRLEPRLAPSHSNNINHSQVVRETRYTLLRLNDTIFFLLSLSLFVCLLFFVVFFSEMDVYFIFKTCVLVCRWQRRRRMPTSMTDWLAGTPPGRITRRVSGEAFLRRHLRRRRPPPLRRHRRPLRHHPPRPSTEASRSITTRRIVSSRISSSSKWWPNRSQWITITLIATALDRPKLPLRQPSTSWITAEEEEVELAMMATPSLRSTRSSTPITPDGGRMKCYPDTDTGSGYIYSFTKYYYYY